MLARYLPSGSETQNGNNKRCLMMPEFTEANFPVHRASDGKL